MQAEFSRYLIPADGGLRFYRHRVMRIVTLIDLPLRKEPFVSGD